MASLLLVDGSLIVVWISLCTVLAAIKSDFWSVGIACLVFFGVNYLSKVLCEHGLLFSTRYKLLKTHKLALWHNEVVSMLHSTVCSAGVAMVLLNERQIFSDLYWGNSFWSRKVLCISTGYFAYDLWDMVETRLYIKSPSIIVHHSVLLICYTTALYKSTCVPYLILTLLCEFNSIFLHVRTLYNLLADGDAPVTEKNENEKEKEKENENENETEIPTMPPSEANASTAQSPEGQIATTSVATPDRATLTTDTKSLDPQAHNFMRINWLLLWLTFWTTRIALHLLIVPLVYVNRDGFQSLTEFCLAFFGMIVFNVLNIELFGSLRKAYKRFVKESSGSPNALELSSKPKPKAVS